ncbi:serum paraoxonase/arylesterase [Phlegmacium glaucopus]|nr:serum paraoxonase/arylesterase [Phlegmacium glaucopus]
MKTLALNILVVSIAIAGGFYKIYLQPLLFTFGYSPTRIIEQRGNEDCKNIPELKACEKIVLHQSTGVLYLACSHPHSRSHWLPAAGLLNVTGASNDDYVATYDPATSRVTRLSTPNFNNGRGLSLLGMDVVPSSSDPQELFIYLVNLRIPLGDRSATQVGADSVIEIFKTTVGGKALTHIKTVEDPIIISPNDVLGSADGKSFHFTNDNGAKVGLMRYSNLLGVKTSSVGYCHIDHGCKYAITGTHGSNGITSAPNGTVYVSNSIYGGVLFLERQADNTLVISESVKSDYILDNLAIDADGQLWAAGIPHALAAVAQIFNPSRLSPSIAARISINTGPNAFYGEKYKLEKVFEDDGKIMSGATSAAYDSQRKRLFMNGVVSQLVVCNI